jgi:hypothetical protein
MVQRNMGLPWDGMCLFLSNVGTSHHTPFIVGVLSFYCRVLSLLLWGSYPFYSGVLHPFIVGIVPFYCRVISSNVT